jgi:hypothetical protein
MIHPHGAWHRTKSGYDFKPTTKRPEKERLALDWEPKVGAPYDEGRHYGKLLSVPNRNAGNLHEHLTQGDRLMRGYG